MTEATPFERYKDALRRGHVAALRQRFPEALAAYEEAAGLAPDRALPLTGRGTVLARMGDAAGALAAFEGALARAPRDEGALTGRAEALAALGRRGDASVAFDELAEVHDRAGRLVQASEAARAALELAESRHRRSLVREFADRLASAPADERAHRELEQVRALLAAGDLAPDPSHAPRAGSAARHERVATPTTGSAGRPVDVAALSRRADEALDLGDTASAREAFLELAQAHRSAGRIDAGLDAGYLALSIAPGNVELHLELVALYLERGWRAPAADKLRLLGKLVDLTDDTDSIRRFEATVADRFGDLGADGPATG